MPILDVTDQVRFGLSDGTCLPMTECICGATWPMWHGPLLGVEGYPTACPKCERKFYWETKVYEVT